VLVIGPILKFSTSNWVHWELICAISLCLLWISENGQSKLETKWTNEITLSDGIQVIEGAVNAKPESVWMTTIMLQLSIHPPASLCAQTMCTWSWFWKFHMVGHGNWGEETGQEKPTKLGYTNETLVNRSICSILPAESAGMRQHSPIYHSGTMCSSRS